MKVKVKKTRAERKQHSREMQAKHDAEKKATRERRSIQRDILGSLGIPKGHAGRAMVSKVVAESMMKGDSQAQIILSLTGSDLLNKAQQAESERLGVSLDIENYCTLRLFFDLTYFRWY